MKCCSINVFFISRSHPKGVKKEPLSVMVNVLPTTIERGSLNGNFTRKHSKIQSKNDACAPRAEDARRVRCASEHDLDLPRARHGPIREGGPAAAAGRERRDDGAAQ